MHLAARCLVVFFACFFFVEKGISQETHFVVVIPSYNNEAWALQNLQSIASQTYDNWSMIYIDDCSTDTTAAIVRTFIKENNLQKKCTLISNEKRQGSLANMYRAISSCKPTDVIVIVDGDDRLAHSKVFEKLAKVYSNPKIWMTYGNFRSDPPGWPSCCARIPLSVKKNNAFRQYAWVSSHLRTFYAKLFHLIRSEDLLWNGSFFPMTHDMAIMFPIIEMASKNHFLFIHEVLYIYNTANPIMDWRVNAQLQRDLDAYIRNMPPYQPLDTLF